jgi:Xaa-Pro aminopeptidase
MNETIARIQAALREADVDGWLFYDFRHSDPIAYRILKLDERRLGTRRWFYFIPADGEPVKIVHIIESEQLDALPGAKLIYLPWSQLHEHLQRVLRGRRRIAMQYSPNNDIPYISRVDAGTIELLRRFGVEIVSSADLVQHFEAVWSPEQLQTHLEAEPKMRRIVDETFAEIARCVASGRPTDEYRLQQFILQCFEREGLVTDHPPIVAADAHSANPHYSPTPDSAWPIREGTFVLIDLWAKLRDVPRAVYVDITWTGFVGDVVPDRYARVFHVVREARDRAIAFVREAVRTRRPIHGWEVDDVAREVIRRAGLGDFFIHRTGHSIGEDVHGNGANIDNLETRDNRRILPHTCFSIEPGVYLEGEFGVRSEVDVYVGDEDVIVTARPIQTEIVPILTLL